MALKDDSSIVSSDFGHDKIPSVTDPKPVACDTQSADDIRAAPATASPPASTSVLSTRKRQKPASDSYDEGGPTKIHCTQAAVRAIFATPQRSVGMPADLRCGKAIEIHPLRLEVKLLPRVRKVSISSEIKDAYSKLAAQYQRGIKVSMEVDSLIDTGDGVEDEVVAHAAAEISKAAKPLDGHVYIGDFNDIFCDPSSPNYAPFSNEAWSRLSKEARCEARDFRGPQARAKIMQHLKTMKKLVAIVHVRNHIFVVSIKPQQKKMLLFDTDPDPKYIVKDNKTCSMIIKTALGEPVVG